MLKDITALEGNFHSFPSQPFLASSNFHDSPAFHIYKNAATPAEVSCDTDHKAPNI